MVEKAETYDWDEIKTLLAKPTQSGVEHAAYMAASKTQRNAWKMGDPFILFGECRDRKRDDKHLVSRSALSFDFDEGADNLFFMLAVLGDVFGDFAFVWHTTRSHAVGNARLRVYVPLSRDVLPDEYKTLCAIVAKLFGATLDPASLKPAQMMFLPVQNSGAVFDFGEHEGDGYLNPDYYLARVKTAPTPQQNETVDVAPDPLANAKPPLANWSIERVKTDLLAHLSSDIDHDDWVKIGQALHHQFAGSDDALRLWDLWSKEGVHDRYQEAECARRWASFKVAREHGRGPITLASLIQMANDFQAEMHAQEIEHLAALSDLAYDQARKGVAKRLGVTVGALDKAVKAVRATDATDGGDFPHVEPWQDPVEGAALLLEIVQAVQRFIVCDQATAQAATLWIAMTWLMDAVNVAPIAAITAPEKRCGKSQLLTVIGRLVCRPLMASNITASALFRVIAAWGPTLLIDEADAFMRENEELRGILNCGHTRELAHVIRTVGEDYTPKQFPVFGAKAIAGIGRLADTLMDRSIVLVLRRKRPHEHVEKLRFAEPGLFETLRAKLARWTRDNESAVRMARPALPYALHDRAADNWEPLFQVAHAAGGPWPDLARVAALALSNNSEQTQSAGAELLADIQAIFEAQGVQRVTTIDLLRALVTDDEKPWATWLGGRPMSPRSLGKMLSEYGIRSKSLRSGHEVCKGYERDQFVDAFERYLQATSASVSVAVTESQPDTDVGLEQTAFEVVPDTPICSVTLEPSLDKVVTV